MKNFIIIILISGFIVSCKVGSDSEVQNESVYFPIKDYVEVAAQGMDGLRILKQLNVNGEKETIQDTLSTEDWLKELDFFIQADISRPSLSTAYETQRSETFLIHTLREGEKGEVQKIVVKYEGDLIKEVSFHIKKSNLFYNSEIRGAMFNKSITGKLDHFSIETFQKVIFLKPNKMIIHSSVVW